MLTMLSAVATCERELMLERKREAQAVNPTKRGNGKAVDREGIKKALSDGLSVRKPPRALMLLLQRYSELRRKKRRRNASLIFGDSGFSRSGALKIALSTSRNLAIREGI